MLHGMHAMSKYDSKRSYDDLFNRPPELSSTMKESASKFNFDYELSPSIDMKLQSHNRQVRELIRNTTSYLEDVILNSNEPIEINETDEITVNGQTGIWANKAEIVDWKGQIPLSHYAVNLDPNPEIINKKTKQEIDYIQELAVRYLRPPTPPTPGEIIIRKMPNIVTPPAPPLIIRQQPPRPVTPQPMVIREAPPPPPKPIGRKVINISGKRLPPPPRKVIVERLAPLPSKPQSVLIERWLPYPQVKRRVIYKQQPSVDPVMVKPKNVIIQWEAPQVNVKKVVRNLGVIRANPSDYVKRYGHQLREADELPDYVKKIRPDFELACQQTQQPRVPDLCGDVYALNMVDMDREGLSEYKPALAKYNSSFSKSIMNSDSMMTSTKTSLNQMTSSVAPSTSTRKPIASHLVDYNQLLIDKIFSQVNVSYDGKISVNEAKKVFYQVNVILGKEFNESMLINLFKSLGVYTNCFIDFEEFKRSLKTIL